MTINTTNTETTCEYKCATCLCRNTCRTVDENFNNLPVSFVQAVYGSKMTFETIQDVINNAFGRVNTFEQGVDYMIRRYGENLFDKN